MNKKKKRKKIKKNGITNTGLFDLIISVFRNNPNKKLNYKQLSKILKIKDLGVKIQLVEVMKELELSGVLEEFQKGSYRIVEKRDTVFAKIKNTNSRGAFVEIDSENEIFIPKKSCSFVLAGDEVELLVFPKRKGKKEGEVVNVLKRIKTEFVGVIDSSSSNYFLIPDDRRVFF